VHEYIDSVGFRAGMETLRSDRRTLVNMGGEGELEIDVLTTGFGFLLESMLGSTAGPTQEAATAAYTTTATTSSDAPGISYTVQIQRVAVDGSLQSFTHHGGTITSWSLMQEVGGLLVATLQADFEDVDTSTGAGTPAYAAGNVPFDWTMLDVTLDSVSTDLTKFELEGDLGLVTDRRFLKSSSLKAQPVRSSVPSYEGSMELEYQGEVEYDDFVAGNVVPIIATWTGATIEGAHNYELEITCAACQYTGDAPVSSLDGVPTMTVPFKVLDNGTDPAIQITYKSTDTAL